MAVVLRAQLQRAFCENSQNSGYLSRSCGCRITARVRANFFAAQIQFCDRPGDAGHRFARTAIGTIGTVDK